MDDTFDVLDHDRNGLLKVHSGESRDDQKGVTSHTASYSLLGLLYYIIVIVYTVCSSIYIYNIYNNIIL